MVLKSISLANAPTLTPSEQGQRSKDWAEALFPKIPEAMLDQSFQRAVHDHKGGFPISAYEVLNAYELLIANPDVNRPPSAGALPEAESEVQRRLNCQRCFGTGQLHLIDIDGRIVGVKGPGSCDHRPMGANEARLFKPSDAIRT
jgi:hypothetical protein